MKPYAATGGKPNFVEGITPIGLVCHAYHDKPQLKTLDQYGKQPDIDPETGIQRAEYKITLAWSKTRENELQETIGLALRVQEEAWPGSTAPGAFFQLEPFFRDGDNPAHNTQNKDYLRGRYYLNFKSKAKAVRNNMGQVTYEGAPGLLGPYADTIMPGDLWPGCTARVSYIMFGTEYAGKHFISTRLQNIQKYDEGDGQRIGGGQRPTAASQFGALKEGMGGSFPANPFAQQGAAPAANPFAQPMQPALGASPSNPFGGTMPSTFGAPPNRMI